MSGSRRNCGRSAPIWSGSATADLVTRGLATTLSDRQALWAFVLGCVAVTIGVAMHIPMFLMGRTMHYRLAGMAMGWDMVLGMGLIIAGVGIAAYGLLPRDIARQRAES